MLRRRPPRKVTYFEPVPPASRINRQTAPWSGSRLRTNGYNPDSIFPDSRTSFETKRRSA